MYLAKTNVGNDDLARQAGALINLARSGGSLSAFAARSFLDSIMSCDVVAERRHARSFPDFARTNGLAGAAISSLPPLPRPFPSPERNLIRES